MSAEVVIISPPPSKAEAADPFDSVDPRTLAPTLFAGPPAPVTATAIAHAESVPTALALLLVSPEFQRR